MSKVFAFITVYNPEEPVKGNVAEISKQVDFAFVCDNSSKCNLDIFNNLKNIKYCWYGKNNGLSIAFNLAIKENLHDFCDDDYLIFFDQDSSVEFGHVKELVDEFEYLIKKGIKIGCLGPAFFNVNSGLVEIPRIKTKIEEKLYNVQSIITSSMLCKFSVLRSVGYWNDLIFLDFADWDLCWRFKKNGYACILTERKILKHRLGVGERKVGPVHIRIGASIREYYQTRDACYLIRCDYVPMNMRIRLLLNLTVRPFVHMLFLSDKKKRLFYIFRGFRDAINKIKGEFK